MNTNPNTKKAIKLIAVQDGRQVVLYGKIKSQDENSVLFQTGTGKIYRFYFYELLELSETKHPFRNLRGKK